MLSRKKVAASRGMERPREDSPGEESLKRKVVLLMHAYLRKKGKGGPYVEKDASRTRVVQEVGYAAGSTEPMASVRRNRRGKYALLVSEGKCFCSDMADPYIYDGFCVPARLGNPVYVLMRLGTLWDVYRVSGGKGAQPTLFRVGEDLEKESAWKAAVSDSVTLLFWFQDALAEETGSWEEGTCIARGFSEEGPRDGSPQIF